MSEVGIAVGIMAGLALLFAAVLAVAYHFLKVEEDPRLERTEELLPGTNCGACGEPGCRGLAEKIVARLAQPGACTVAGADDLERIAAYLGVEVGEQQKRVARLRCAGGEGNVAELATYAGEASCRAAVLVDGGGRACPWGCLGLADCERACTFDAIAMSPEGLPVVDPDLCTACGDCVDVCPLDLFVLDERDHKLFVQCASPLTGTEATSRCAVACDACGRCAADAPADAIEMVDGLPVIHWDRAARPGAEATWRCPTGAIQWLADGRQLVSVEALRLSAPRATGGRHA